MFRWILLVGLASVAMSAPLQSETLQRVKRSEEVIMFGNHQNNARVKKSGPEPPLGVDMPHPSGTEGEDHEAKVKVETKITSQKLGDGPEIDTKITKQQINDEPEKVVEDTVSVDGEKVEGDEAEEIKGAALDEEFNKIMDAEETALTGLGEKEVNGMPDSVDNMWNELMEYYYDLLPSDVAGSKVNKRGKRDLSKTQSKALVAEDMTVGAQNKARNRRDLNLRPDELSYIFGEDSQESPIDEGEKESDIEDTVEELYSELTRKAYEDEMMNLYYRWMEENEEEAREDEALEKLRYLQSTYNNEESSPEYVPSPEYEDTEESYSPGSEVVPYGDQDYENEVNEEFEPIYYNGMAGIFVPLDTSSSVVAKRQLPLSVVPGNKKRSYYPSTEGSWNVPETETRNEEAMYERLFQLAESLRERKAEQEADAFWENLKK